VRQKTVAGTRSAGLRGGGRGEQQQEAEAVVHEAQAAEKLLLFTKKIK
jgi:hypothetical protein